MSLKSQISKIKKEIGLVNHDGMLGMYSMRDMHDFEAGKNPGPSWYIPDTPENRKMKYDLEHPEEKERSYINNED